MRFLVVDDSAVIRKVARRMLQGMRFDTIEAADGPGALRECSEQMPDAILLDWNMPETDSLEFLRQLRQLPDGGRPKVLFCTTEYDVAQIARAMRAGADEYIMKPFDQQIMRSKLEDVGLA